MSKEFSFKPAAFLPVHDAAVLEKCRNIKRDDMEYTNEHGFSVKVVPNPTYLFIVDCFERIKKSDEEDTHLTMIFPNVNQGAAETVHPE